MRPSGRGRQTLDDVEMCDCNRNQLQQYEAELEGFRFGADASEEVIEKAEAEKKLREN